VVAALRRKLKLGEGALWCYVGSFVPAMDEGVGALWKVCLLLCGFVVV
jgi:hypothetical protein